MDFKLPENTTMIADTARRYLKDNYSFDTYIAQLNESNHLEANRWQAMNDLGWFGLPFAESVGGYGGSLLDVCAIVQELGAALCLDPFVDLIVSPGKLLEFANTPTSLALLDRIIAGEARVACGLYDRHAGYHVLNPSLRLNGERLSGQKHVVSDGGVADAVLVSAMSGDELVIGDHFFTLELESLEAPPSLTGSMVDVGSIDTPDRKNQQVAVGLLIVALVVGWLVLF